MAAFAINYFQQGCKSSMVSHWAGRSWVGRTLGFKHSPLLPLPASRLSSATHSSFHRNSPTWISPGKNSPTKFSPEKNSSTLLVCYYRSNLALPLQTSLKNAKQETRDGRKKWTSLSISSLKIHAFTFNVALPCEGASRGKEEKQKHSFIEGGSG